MNYFEGLNCDIISIVISYLDLSNLLNLITIYNNLVDWNSAFIYEYKNYLFFNIHNYDIKRLYFGFKSKEDNYKQIDFINYVASNNIFIQECNILNENIIGRNADIYAYEILKNKYDKAKICFYAYLNKNEFFTRHIFIEMLNCCNQNLLNRFLLDLSNEIQDDYYIDEEKFKIVNTLIQLYPPLLDYLLPDIIAHCKHYNRFIDIFIKYFFGNFQILFDKIFELEIYDIPNLVTLILEANNIDKDTLLRFYESYIGRGERLFFIDDEAYPDFHFHTITSMASIKCIKENYMPNHEHHPEICKDMIKIEDILIKAKLSLFENLINIKSDKLFKVLDEHYHSLEKKIIDLFWDYIYKYENTKNKKTLMMITYIANLDIIKNKFMKLNYE